MIDIEFIIRAFLLISVVLILTYPQWKSTFLRMIGRFYRKPIPKERDFIDKAPSKILETFRQLESLTSIQSDRMSEPFIGLWLKAEGRVKDVSEGFNFLWIHEITVDIEIADEIDIHLGFEKYKWESKLKVISKEDQVTFIGRIESVSSYTIYLENCEIIESR